MKTLIILIASIWLLIACTFVYIGNDGVLIDNGKEGLIIEGMENAK